MTHYSRPDELVFASGAKPGEVQGFPDIPRGWGVAYDQTAGIPPMEWFNALFKRGDEGLRYLLQRGIADWSATEDYPVDAHVQEGGKVWKAKVANLGKRPSVNPGEWVETALTREALKALIQEQLGGGTLNFGQWQWSSATSGGVANGYLALNATNPADATALMIAKSSAEGLDYSRSVALLRAGDTLCIQSRPGGSVAHRFRVTGELVDSGAYRSVPVVYVSGAGGVPASNALLQVLMTPAGGSVPYANALDAQTDFNTITEPGWYPRLLGANAGSRNANHPDAQTGMQKGNGVTNYYWLLVARYATNLIQVALPYVSGADTTIATIKFRLLGGGVWSPWRSLMHSENSQGSGVPMASVMWWSYRSSIPDGWAPADGQLLSRALFPDVWAAIRDGKVPKTSEATWSGNPTQRGMFTEGDGSTTFRMPDYNGKAVGSLGALFMRGDGALSAAVAGAIQPDAMQGHRHSPLTGRSYMVAMPNTGTSQPNPGISMTEAPTTENPVTDGVNGTPRTASETRPLNVTGCWIIKMGSGVNNPGAIDAAAVSSTYAALVTRVEALEMRPRSVGDGQAWQDVTASRASGVTYTNSSGRPKLVSIFAANGLATRGISVGGVLVSQFTPTSAGTISTTISAVVPNGATYSVTAGTSINTWMELV
ncbi:hypothetical protein [Metapseudomonas otitidis]|uniref:hypothetical protein n=1 Tax=Metapseudomonas otitidis TaxID=319939 RepID=UPI002447CEE3|nr:hypothetical protein [Pseudomonas otitidis]MDG9780797.1 hypothetical protein [Pseudomonas otitidis]